MYHGHDQDNCHHRLPIALCGPFSRPRIPIELQEMVVRSLAPHGEWPDAATLASSALVCRVWYHMVTKLLYAHIQIFGRKSYKLLERTLKNNHVPDIVVHTLLIHDVTPSERTSVEVFHPPLPIQHHLESLFISGTGTHDPEDKEGGTVRSGAPPSAPPQPFTFPYRHSLLADLPRFKSLQRIHLYDLAFDSLAHLRRLLGGIPRLHAAALRKVSWGNPNVEFQPLFNATSWQLAQFSLSHCSSNFIAPFFWGMPLIPRRNDQKKSGGHDAIQGKWRGRDGNHPPLCTQDVALIVELAVLLLVPKDNVVESVCWEWKNAGKEDDHCMYLYLWSYDDD